MFHLSLPVGRFHECIAFYRTCFEAQVVELSPTAANILAYGAQITFHDNPVSPLTDEARRQLHFGPVVEEEQWFAIRDRLIAGGYPLLKCIAPDAATSRRGKLVVADPGGNLVEVNTGA